MRTEMDAVSLESGDAASFRRFASRAEPEAALVALKMAQARARAQGDSGRVTHWAKCHGELLRVLEDDPPLRISDLAIRGGEVIEHVGLKGGAWVKDVLAVLLEAVLSDPVSYTHLTLPTKA